MSEILESIIQRIRERITSPLYGTYTLSTIIWNWKFFYVLFFQDQANILIPKIEYIEQLFLSGNWFLHILFFFVPPLILTYLIIWWLPIINNFAYKTYIRFSLQHKSIYSEEKLRQEKQEKTILDDLAKVKEKQSVSKKKIQRNLSQEDRWEAEYKEFQKSFLFKNFQEIIDAIYKHAGWLHNTTVSHNLLALTESRNLIFFSTDRRQISLTEKGKIFTKKYLDNPLSQPSVSF